MWQVYNKLSTAALHSSSADNTLPLGCEQVGIEFYRGVHTTGGGPSVATGFHCPGHGGTYLDGGGLCTSAIPEKNLLVMWPPGLPGAAGFRIPSSSSAFDSG